MEIFMNSSKDLELMNKLLENFNMNWDHSIENYEMFLIAFIQS